MRSSVVRVSTKALATVARDPPSTTYKSMANTPDHLEALSAPCKALKVRDVESILLQGLEPLAAAEDTYEAHIRPSARHAYLPHYDWLSPVLQSEVHRQFSVAVMRCFFSVPNSFDYALQKYSLVVEATDPSVVPDRIVCELVSSERRGEALSSAQLRIRMFAGQAVLSVAELGGPLLPESVLKGLMNSQFAEGALSELEVEPIRIAPERVGRREFSEVLVGGAKSMSKEEGVLSHVAGFVGSSSHPYFHHNISAPDHVPGAMVFEACLQHMALVMEASVVPRSLDVELHRFLELSIPAQMSSTVREDTQPGQFVAIVEFVQRGRLACRARLSFHRAE